MGVSSIEEVIKGVRVGGVDFSVVDEILSGVLGVVWPCILGQPPHQPQNGAVCFQSLLHSLPSFKLPTTHPLSVVHLFLVHNGPYLGRVQFCLKETQVEWVRSPFVKPYAAGFSPLATLKSGMDDPHENQSVFK